jgi:hypothetical protein
MIDARGKSGPVQVASTILQSVRRMYFDFEQADTFCPSRSFPKERHFGPFHINLHEVYSRPPNEIKQFVDRQCLGYTYDVFGVTYVEGPALRAAVRYFQSSLTPYGAVYDAASISMSLGVSQTQFEIILVEFDP